MTAATGGVVTEGVLTDGVVTEGKVTEGIVTDGELPEEPEEVAAAGAVVAAGAFNPGTDPAGVLVPD